MVSDGVQYEQEVSWYLYLMEFLVDIVDEKKWNEFVVANNGSFLQSWQWGEFQKKEGHHITRTAVMENNSIILCTTVIRHELPMKKHYVYVPYGPVMIQNTIKTLDVFSFFIQNVKEKLAKNTTLFIKIEPDEHVPLDLKNVGFIQSEKNVQATETMVMDLTLSEEELLARMKQKTRYNMRLAERKEVRIVSIDDTHEAKKTFLSLLSDTARRNGFRLHPQKHYNEMMNMFLESDAKPHDFALRLVFAFYKEEVLAAGLIGFFGGRATYLHGGSSDIHKEFMAPYLLHWEIMRTVKRMGYKEYDFWGITTNRTKKEQKVKWEGFSRFKQGFSGSVVEYPGAHDLVLKRMWYNAYRIGRKIKP